LVALREAAGLYQVDIARAVPCHRTTVTHAEAGSQLPASDFWETADRLVGANGALIASYDELVNAKAAHLAEQQAERRARAHATVRELTAVPPLKPEQVSPAFPAQEDPQRDLAACVSGVSSEDMMLRELLRLLSMIGVLVTPSGTDDQTGRLDCSYVNSDRFDNGAVDEY
jgi:transcriptional regulator with XRE-family HTH domain